MPQDLAVVRATVVESFQSASTGLYASVGMSPQAVKYWLSGTSRSGVLGTLPSDLHRARLTEADQIDIDALDRSLLGFARSADHGWWQRGGTPCWSYRHGSDLVAYGYIDGDYIGPVLAVDERTLCASSRM
jgi:hypothetical protein